MNPTILNFVTKERVCVLSVLLPGGTPHSAALHYSHQDDPLKIFVQTTKNSEKVKGIINGEITKASLVIGFSEQNWLTLQMRGDLRVISDKNRLEEIYKIHYKKNPDAEQYKSSPQTIFLEFTPLWWRYTDFNTDPETIILNT